MSIKINSIAFSVSQKYNITNDICSICKNSIYDNPDCLCERYGHKCFSLINECTHVFHVCCINQYFKYNKCFSCPLCKKKWNPLKK